MVLTFVKDHWLPITGLLTITAYLAGMAYFHAFLGAFGFGQTVYSLDPITILAYGGLTAVLAIGAQGLILAGLIPLSISIGQRTRGTRAVKTLDAINRGVKHFGPYGAAVTIIIALATPWQWLVPGLLTVFVKFGKTGIILLASLFVLCYAIALAGLRGRAFAVFIVTLLLSSAPGMTYLLGTQTADRLAHDPDAFPRVLIWWNETQERPTGYVLVHQDADRLYLLLIRPYVDPTDGIEKKLYTSTTASIDDVYRVEFFGAGTEIERIHREARLS